MQSVLITHTAEQTEQLGRRLARCLLPGDVVTLYGPLGAGKTALVRGICAGLGCSVRASSPSYALVHVYDGPVPVCHYDLYRVAAGDEMVAMEVEESMDERSVLLIEWPDPVADSLPQSALSITLAANDGDNGRVITIKGEDTPWKKRFTGVCP